MKTEMHALASIRLVTTLGLALTVLLVWYTYTNSGETTATAQRVGELRAQVRDISVAVQQVARTTESNYRILMEMRGSKDGMLSKEELRLWNREGYLIIRGMLSDEKVNQLRTYLDELQNMPTVKGGVWKYFESDRNDQSKKLLNRIEKFTDYHRGLRDMVFSPEIIGRVSELLGGPAVLFKEKVNFKLPGGGGFEPHQDMQPGWDKYAKQMVSVLLVVDENTRNNGCLQLAPGSHARPGGLIGRMNEPLNETETTGLKWIYAELSPGDVLFFDAWAPHRSDPNNSPQPRRNTYLTFNAKKDGDHRAAYYADKFRSLPPDADRDPNKDYKYRV
eukprot:Sspe_Gene.5233::Locus_1725_Transcript_1_1_Confidence_1.000_Length_1201::g.5233::m.5233/K21195/phnY; 2-aminoethylphosphonate dioxygenase